MEAQGDKRERVTAEVEGGGGDGGAWFFNKWPAQVWQLVALPWLGLRDRAALWRTHHATHTYGLKLDGTIAFMCSVWSLPYVSPADRLMIVKRSGRLECLHWAWDKYVPFGTVVTNADLLLHWVLHVVSPATGNAEALHWALGKTMYRANDWPQLVVSTVEMMLRSESVTMQEAAYAVGTNEGGSWWHAPTYNHEMREPEALQRLGIRFMRCQRWDLIPRLLTDCWPTTINAGSRYSLGLIIAIRSEDMAVFTGWWHSSVCKGMWPADAPPPQRILASIVMTMAQHGNPGLALSAQLMGNDLMAFMVSP